MNVCALCTQNDDVISQAAHEQIIVALAPLLEKNRPTQEICNFFSKVCSCVLRAVGVGVSVCCGGCVCVCYMIYSVI